VVSKKAVLSRVCPVREVSYVAGWSLTRHRRHRTDGGSKRPPDVLVERDVESMARRLARSSLTFLRDLAQHEHVVVADLVAAISRGGRCRGT